MVARLLTRRGGIFQEADVIIVSYHLEGRLSGLDFLREIRAARITTPAIFLTSFLPGELRLPAHTTYIEKGTEDAEPERVIALAERLARPR